MLHWLWQQNHRVNWPKRTWIFLKNSGKNKSVFSQMLSMTLLPLMTSWLCQVMSWFPREACEDVHNYFCLSYNNGQSKRPQVWQVIYFSNNTVLIFILLKNKNQKNYHWLLSSGWWSWTCFPCAGGDLNLGSIHQKAGWQRFFPVYIIE